MFESIMEELGKVILAVFGIVCFLVIVALLPFAFIFMLLLECVIRGLDAIISHCSSDDNMSKDDWKRS